MSEQRKELMISTVQTTMDVIRLVYYWAELQEKGNLENGPARLSALRKQERILEEKLGGNLTPGHFEAVGLDSSSDDGPAGTAGSVWLCDKFHNLTGVTLPF